MPREFRLRVFYESVSPGPLSIPLGPYQRKMLYLKTERCFGSVLKHILSENRRWLQKEIIWFLNRVKRRFIWCMRSNRYVMEYRCRNKGRCVNFEHHSKAKFQKLTMIKGYLSFFYVKSNRKIKCLGTVSVGVDN